MTTGKELLLVTRDEQGLITTVTGKTNRTFEIYTTKVADLDEVEELHKKLSGQKDYLPKEELLA